MKKISFILMALAMVMGMTQCKKENLDGNGTTVLEGDEVQITLTLNSGSSSSKADVIPDGNGNAPVRFKARNGDVPGDYIWVAYDGKLSVTWNAPRFPLLRTRMVINWVCSPVRLPLLRMETNRCISIFLGTSNPFLCMTMMTTA